MFESLFDLSPRVVGPVIIGAFYWFPVDGLLLGIKRLPKWQQFVPRKPARLALRLFLFLVVTVAPVVNAQESSTSNEFWPEIDVYIKVKPKVRIYLIGTISKSVEDGEIRNAQGFEAQIGAHIDYIPNDHLILRTGYRYGTSVGDSDDSFKEHRLLKAVDSALSKLIKTIEVIPMAIKTGKRELIDTGTDKRFVKRDKSGRFKESVDVGRSLAADRRSKSKTVAKPGYGDQGDQPKRTTSRSSLPQPTGLPVRKRVFERGAR